MGDEERDFRDDLRINKFKLEEECEKQPSNYGYWANLLSEARADKDQAEDKLDLLEAQVELNYRTNPPKRMKVTEGTIKSMVESNKEIQEQKDLLRSKKSEVYHLETAVKALEQKKSSLDNLVTLFVKGFYSQPDGKRRSKTDESEVNSRKNLNRNRRDKDE
jgi:regulator of replication initiation timing